jgi:hypothetical protein
VTHGVPRDPVLVAGVVRVTDAARVVVRLIQPQDAGLQRAFFRGLSQESRYGRFMAMVKDAPEALIERLAPVDHIHHPALLAVVIEHGREVMIVEASSSSTTYLASPIMTSRPCSITTASSAR